MPPSSGSGVERTWTIRVCPGCDMFDDPGDGLACKCATDPGPELESVRVVPESVLRAEREARERWKAGYEAKEAALERAEEALRRIDGGAALIEDMLERYGDRLTSARIRAVLGDARRIRREVAAVLGGK